MAIDFEKAGEEPITFNESAYIGVGDHEVTITDIEAKLTKTGKPMLVIEYSDKDGRSRTEWLAYGFEFGNRKLATLIQVVGLEYPDDDEQDEDTGLLEKSYIKRFKKKTLIVHVRPDEEDEKHRPRVAGVSKVGTVKPTEVAAFGAGSTNYEDDIPF